MGARVPAIPPVFGSVGPLVTAMSQVPVAQLWIDQWKTGKQSRIDCPSQSSDNCSEEGRWDIGSQLAHVPPLEIHVGDEGSVGINPGRCGLR